MKVLAKSVALMVGAACGDDATLPADSDSYTAVAWGANVIPVRPPVDTSARASVLYNTATLEYSYSIAVPPPGTIDSIALYQVRAGLPLPDVATAILCSGVAACSAQSGTGTVLAPATAASIKSSIRGYGTQVVFFTTTAQKASGGAMRGTVYTGQ
jgi:hypothetical protein